MALPKVYVPAEPVEIAGQLFEVRVVTRAEAARFQKMVTDGADPADLEIAVIAAATDTPVEETRQWYQQIPAWVAGELAAHIRRVSRLDEEAQKSSSAGDHAG